MILIVSGDALLYSTLIFLTVYDYTPLWHFKPGGVVQGFEIPAKRCIKRLTALCLLCVYCVLYN